MHSSKYYVVLVVPGTVATVVAVQVREGILKNHGSHPARALNTFHR